MALRKFLFMSSPEGYSEEGAATDSLALGGLTMSGSIDMGHQTIVNLEGPTNPEDAANKEYVDALASGLVIHASCVVKTAAPLGPRALLVGSGGVGSNLPMAGETVDIAVDGVAAVTVTFTTEATIAAVATTINTALSAAIGVVNTDQIDLRSTQYGLNSSIVVSNVSNVSLTNKTGIAAGTALGGFTPVGAGVGATLEAPTDSVTYNTIDGVALASIGQRVLVSMESGTVDTVADKHNGIYTVSAVGDGAGVKFKLTRATDFDAYSTAEVHQGAYAFVSSGTTNTNTGWTLVTTGTIIVDTTAIKWSQFSGAPGYTYGQGLQKLGADIQLELDTAAAAQTAGAGGGSSGLEYDADTAAGKLRAAVNATGGLERSASGLTVKIASADQLAASGSGLAVVGVPAGFKIGAGSTNSTNVTSTNLDLLVGGASITLHSHAAPTNAWLVVAGSPGVNKGDPVYVTATDNKIDQADTTAAKAKCIGLAVETKAAGASCGVQAIGVLTGVLTGTPTAGTPFYIATGGGLSAALPGAGKRVIQAGIALNSTDILIRIVDYGMKAA